MEREKNLETVLAILTALVVVYLLTAVRPFLFAAAILGLIGLLANRIAGRITRLWLKLSEILGLISSRLLLLAIFFVFLLPTAMLSRLFSKKGPPLGKEQ